MPRQFRPVDAAVLADVLAGYRSGDQPREETRVLVKHYLAVLQERAPGHSVEVRVPPFAAAQAIPGVRHKRGTPPAVVELDAGTWIALATGELSWADARDTGRVRASGERADLTAYLPLT